MIPPKRRRKHNKDNWKPTPKQLTVEKRRWKQLVEVFPQVLNVKSILNVGAYRKRFHFADKLRASGALVDVLEIDHERCKWLRTQRWIHKVVEGDVREVATLVDRNYEMVFWSHGPALLPRSDFEPTITALWDITEKWLVIMTPWGKYPYNSCAMVKDVDYNRSAFYPEDFKSLGFEVDVIGKADIGSFGHLIAWRKR